MDLMTPRRSLGRRSGSRPALRLMGIGTAGVVVLAIGLAGCGAKSAQESADQAAQNLSSAKVATFTLHLVDPKKSLLNDSSMTASDKKSLAMVEDSTFRITIDPPGDSTLGGTPAASSGGDLAKSLKNSGAVELAVTNAGKDIVGLRMVDGVLCVKADLTALSSLSGQDLSSQLAGAPAELSSAVTGLKDGKWLCLDLPGLIAKNPQLSALASGAGSQLSAQQMAELRQKLMAALNSNSTQSVSTADGRTVVTMKVKAKAFLTAAVDALGSTGVPGMPSVSDLKSQLSSMSDGAITATLTAKDGHYTQAALDLHSLAELSTDAQAKSSTDGVQLIADIDDSASAVTAPAAADSVSLNSLVEKVLSGAGSGLLSGLPGLGG
jgi:hypothetical protein